MSVKKLSEKNPYWLPEYREKELLYFVKQYPYWQDELNAINLTNTCKYGREHIKVGAISDPTFSAICERHDLIDRIDMVEKAADDTDPTLGYFLILGITKGYNYENLRLMHGIPCGRELYYKKYHEFFWRLDRLRN